MSTFYWFNFLHNRSLPIDHDRNQLHWIDYQTLKELKPSNTVGNFKRNLNISPIQWGNYKFEVETEDDDPVSVAHWDHSNQHVFTRQNSITKWPRLHSFEKY